MRTPQKALSAAGIVGIGEPYGAFGTVACDDGMVCGGVVLFLSGGNVIAYASCKKSKTKEIPLRAELPPVVIIGHETRSAGGRAIKATLKHKVGSVY